VDGRGFDTFTRQFSVSRSRRGLLGSGVGVVLALIGNGTGHARTCGSPGQVCREHANCCSGSCGPKDRSGRRRCVCGSTSDCPGGSDVCNFVTCIGGACEVAAEPALSLSFTPISESVFCNVVLQAAGLAPSTTYVFQYFGRRDTRIDEFSPVTRTTDAQGNLNTEIPRFRSGVQIELRTCGVATGWTTVACS
jgi:hypothetical protein